MKDLEIVREKVQNRYRVIKNDEDLEWNRAIDLCTNIINAHLSRGNTPEFTRSSRDNEGWIPVEERLPEEPKENPVFDDKPLELYLVDMGGSYPLRAFWNGKEFTDGWSVLKVTAWMPLPDPYRPERSNDEKE